MIRPPDHPAPWLVSKADAARLHGLNEVMGAVKDQQAGLRERRVKEDVQKRQGFAGFFPSLTGTDVRARPSGRLAFVQGRLWSFPGWAVGA